MRKRGRKSTIAAQQIIYERARRGAHGPAVACMRVRIVRVSSVVIVVMHSSVRDGEGENVGEDCGVLTQATRRRRWSGTRFVYRFVWTHAVKATATVTIHLVTTVGEEEKR